MRVNLGSPLARICEDGSGTAELQVLEGSRREAFELTRESGVEAMLRGLGRSKAFKMDTLKEFVSAGAFPWPVAAFLRECVRARANFLVCGTAGAGIAGLIRALAKEIPKGETVAVIDAQSGGFDGKGMPPLSLYVNSSPGRKGSRPGQAGPVARAMAFAPDRLIIPEATAEVMASACVEMSGRVPGSLVGMSGGAGGARHALTRAAWMIKADVESSDYGVAAEMPHLAFDVVARLAVSHDGRRALSELSALDGAGGIFTLYGPGSGMDSGALFGEGMPGKLKAKLSG